MPSPVGHSLIGVAITGAFYLPRGFLRDWVATFRAKKEYFFWGIVFANLPDLDYIPGILIGDLNFYHHIYSHSVGWIGLVTAGSWLVWKVWQPRITWKEAAFLFALLSSHLVADWLTADGREPYGIMLFWPFSDEYWISSKTLFLRLLKREWSEFIQPHNFLAVLVEVAWCVPIFIVLAAIKRRRD